MQRENPGLSPTHQVKSISTSYSSDGVYIITYSGMMMEGMQNDNGRNLNK
jgi:hypothetical protein